MPRPGGTVARGYGRQHTRQRKALIADAYGRACVRCGSAMLPGQALDYDHEDDRTGYRGMAHAACNRRAGGKKAARNRRRREKNLRRNSREW